MIEVRLSLKILQKNLNVQGELFTSVPRLKNFLSKGRGARALL